MSLEQYIKKRSFDKTPEPEAVLEDTSLNRFVIQRHQASHLHYDVRLEMNGVLKSWAVPKGPSMNAGEKRLAIQTEDHPTKYLFFEGTIPKGNYGAGEMTIWDQGMYEVYEKDHRGNASEQWSNGELKIHFKGQKIKGKFTLVKTHGGNQEQWLLIKKKDDYAIGLPYDAEMYVDRGKDANIPTKVKKLPIDRPIRPMLATQGEKAFNDPEWIFEIKWDGYRILSSVIDGEAHLYSRNGIAYRKKFPGIARELESLPHDLILDGEIVVLDTKGLPVFQQLQNFDPDHTTGQLRYYVFDLLHLNGHDTTQLTLLERKSLLPEILEGLENIVYCDHIETLGKAFFNKAIDSGLEGIMAKKASSRYFPGNRSENWLKIKGINTLEAIICGYTESDSRPFGSLILGMYHKDSLVYIGNCGTGFNSDEQKDLVRLLQPLVIKDNPFNKKPSLKGRTAIWVSPNFICEVKYAEWTDKQHLRHPVYKGLRDDKLLQEVNTRAQPTEHKTTASHTDSSSILKIEDQEVKLSNLDKVFWPQAGYRKFDLIDYYIQMADHILPYLANRPQNLHRHPDGIEKKGFYHKDQENIPSFAQSTTIYSKSAQRNIEYILCNNEATLIHLANLGCIELNPWNSTVDDLNHPTYGVIDLDPSPHNSFDEVLQTARKVKEILDRAKIEGYCKTSGSRGLHIYIPMANEYSYEEVRNFIKLLCHFVQQGLSSLTTLERSLKKRNGRIYLDYLQNRRGQTIAAPYSLRPKPGATVSMPVTWNKVMQGFKIEEYDIKTVPQHMEQAHDIFKPVLGKAMDMEKALLNLEA
ncbi:MAG: DNA ligase D [Cytophagaceae bacterium]|nr:DNA ligase D [Cytophagaceae bacterium]|tara:strand:+ start:1363 stop:3786 length:2424 start_codon:yes stop_codon:yes gene_type:complete